MVIDGLSRVDIEGLCGRLRQGGERTAIGGREGYRRGGGGCGRRRVLPTDWVYQREGQDECCVCDVRDWDATREKVW